MKLTVLLPLAVAASAAPSRRGSHHGSGSGSQQSINVQLGPRPYFLVDDMDDGPLKDTLSSCKENTPHTSHWSIGHRGGGTLMIPEESLESIKAGIRMGAGIQECDVTFTSDMQLVCRHSQCDLHTTTNIVATELGAKCTEPFTPADPESGTEASATCCTSDITLAEFKTLCAKMDGSNSSAVTAEDYLDGTPSWRTDLYAQCATVMTHAEFIKHVDGTGLGLHFTPELKTPEVDMPFNGGNYTQQVFARQMLDEYRAAGIAASRVWPQSFLYDDILFWMQQEPEFGAQAVFLDETGDTDETFPYAVGNLSTYAQDGVRIVAPPLYYLVALDDEGNLVPSEYAAAAKELGLDILTWSLERSGRLGDEDRGGYYYTSIANATDNDGDVFGYLDVLARDVGVKGVFSDWSATVTYYANCFGL
ncbi:Extracellular protein [Zalerion maritima]|uniref:glycerophosphodiester phosphodiesterase n=1 Tax=Zalerion maritima TaxID=339359 RepID=A0AAD5WWQ8_9PEZI|nr:Extracellular protein [Zalerion maritima]